MSTSQEKRFLNRMIQSLFLLAMVSLTLGGCGGGGGGGGGGGVTLQSISITPGDSKIAQGTLKQLTATGTFSDNTTQDLTATATWASSDTSITTVDAQGMANNGSATTGVSTISAVSGSVTGTTTLTATDAMDQKFLVLPLLTLNDTPPSQFGTVELSLFGEFTITTQFSTAITGDIDGDQYELAFYLNVDPLSTVSERTLTAQLVIDVSGTETEIFDTTIVVNTATPTLYTHTVVGTDVDVPSGGTLILKLRGDSTNSADNTTRIILSSSDTTNNSIEIPPIL